MDNTEKNKVADPHHVTWLPAEFRLDVESLTKRRYMDSIRTSGRGHRSQHMPNTSKQVLRRASLLPSEQILHNQPYKLPGRFPHAKDLDAPPAVRLLILFGILNALVMIIVELDIQR